MKTFKDILQDIPGGRVLDVATGAGRFVEILKTDLASYTEITGIDLAEHAEQAFKKAFQSPDIHFLSMDANALDFPDDSFDTVTICFSLHHLSDPVAVLREMKRVLRPGGYFIISEMYRDDQTETQMTHVLLHDWWGAVDTACGICHNKTYSRGQILSLLHSLNFSEAKDHDLIDMDDDPCDAENLQYLDGIITQYVQERLPGLSNEQELKAEGEALRQRLQEVGFHSASVLVVVAKK